MWGVSARYERNEDITEYLQGGPRIDEIQAKVEIVGCLVFHVKQKVIWVDYIMGFKGILVIMYDGFLRA